MRRTNRLPLEQLTPYLLDLPDSPRQLAWAEVFGNQNPLEVEVGFGKGLFLLTSALAHADINYLVDRNHPLTAPVAANRYWQHR